MNTQKQILMADHRLEASTNKSLMSNTTTLYSLYELAVVSGNIYTSGQLKFIRRSGEMTKLDRIIKFGTIAQVKKTSSQKSCPSWHKLRVRGSMPFEILFKTRNLNHFGKGKFDRREEECLLVLKKDLLYIFVFKSPTGLSNCLSNPQYWHNHWPYTSSEKQYRYAPIAKRDRVEEKFIRNDQNILDDIDFLKKSLTLLAKKSPSKEADEFPR